MDDDVSVFREKEHYQDLCGHVGELWRQRALCDVNLVVEDDKGKLMMSVSAHKVILAASIPYFRSMFTSDMLESSQKDVSLKGVDDIGLKAIVDFVYSGKVGMTEANVQGMLSTASFLGLQNIVEACAKFMIQHLSSSDCLRMREFGRFFDLHNLLSAANKYAEQNFVLVWKEEDFLGLSVEDVEEFVSNDQITVDSEEDIYTAVTRWINHDKDNREIHVERLYNHVRFPVMDKDFVESVILHNDLIISNKSSKVMVMETMKYHDNPASIILFSNPKKTQPRSSMMGIICMVGGVGDAGGSLTDVTFFSPHEQQWKPGIKLLQHRSRLAVAIFKGELYAIGGCDISQSLSCVEKYSPSTTKWESVASLNTPRRSCAAVVSHFGIHVLGGFSGRVFLHSMEVYNSKLDEWSYQTPMIAARSDHCAIYFDQRIYAIGGVNSCSQLSSVERFDLINKKWEMVAQMNIPRANAGMKIVRANMCCVVLCILSVVGLNFHIWKPDEWVLAMCSGCLHHETVN